MTASTEIDLAYAAAFMDGEGCFQLGWLKKTGRNRCLTIAVSAGNTNRPVLEWFVEHFGGGVYPVRKHKIAPQHQDCFRWRMVGGKQVGVFCSTILPYLKIKQQQAVLLIEAASLLKKGGRRSPTDEQIEYRTRMYEDMKSLHKGRLVDRASDNYTIRVIR